MNEPVPGTPPELTSRGAGERKALAGLRVVVAGLGPMGRGIARLYDRAGAAVGVVDLTPELTGRGLAAIRAEAAADGESPSSVTAAELAGAVPGCDVFVEAVVEDMAVKRELLARVAELPGCWWPRTPPR